MLVKIFIPLLFAFSAANCKEVCYGDIGCFSIAYPFSGVLARPIALLPESPEKISTFFTIYSRKLNQGELISATNLTQTNFNPFLQTKFISHGFLDNAMLPWIIEMKEAILQAEDVNVITVDWSKGSGFPYTQATANTRVVGAEIAKLVNALIQAKGILAKDFHLIGHSLGAHISGYAGKRIKGLGKITGLDPAGPYFENTDPIVRLDSTDALFVDTIHTDGSATIKLGLGLMQALGHVDFYPNGGKSQPNCPGTPGKLLGAIFYGVQGDSEGVDMTAACNHFTSIHLYVDSIKNKNSCKYNGYRCNSIDEFNSGKCLTCTVKGCNKMGYWSSPSNDLGITYLNTKDSLKPPACKQNYLLYLHSTSAFAQAKGKFTIFFKTATQTSSTELLDDPESTFKAGTVEQRLISLSEPLDTSNPIENAYIFFEKTNNFLTGWLFDSSWSFDYIEILSGETQSLVKLCPQKPTIQSNELVQFKKC